MPSPHCLPREKPWAKGCDLAGSQAQKSHGRGPAWLKQAETGVHIDVRPMLAAGEDPLLAVLAKANDIGHGGFLVIDAPFNPKPLRRVLAGQGYSSFGEEVEPRHWRISLCRDGLGAGAEDEGGDGDDGTPKWREGDEIHIDVRGLEPPLPMLAILRLIRGLPHSATVIVHHEREPRFLLPELAEIGWQLEQIQGDPGEVRLRLTRAEK